MDPYKVLEVEWNADDKTIKKAYRRLIKNWHPDLHPNENVDEKIKEINLAFELIGTAEKRAIYDVQNPTTSSVYEHYASKESKKQSWRKKTKKTSDIEKEKQRKAVIQFFHVEFEHKKEIFEMFDEIANGTLHNAFSDEEYLETLNLVLEEAQDCITKIQGIISVAKKKQIQGLEGNFRQAQVAIEEISKKMEDTPSTLEKARYEEETRRITEKVNHIIAGLPKRVIFISGLDILMKTWEFNSEEEYNAYCKKISGKVKKLLRDIEWIEKVALERDIKIGTIEVGRWSGDKRTLSEIKGIVLEKGSNHSLTLEQLRMKFWEEFTNISKNKRLSGRIHYDTESCKGTLIIPQNVSIGNLSFYWLKEISAISIFSQSIDKNTYLELPESYRRKLKYITFNFDNKAQVVDVSKLEHCIVTKKGEYICIEPKYRSELYILVDENGVYVYDNLKLCKLLGVKTVEELRHICRNWLYNFSHYYLQIHAWAQVAGILPSETLMRLIPATAEDVKKWITMDKTNYDKVLSENRTELWERIVRLYIGLGALGDEYSHKRAENLIVQIDIENLYRTRLERIPKENKNNLDPIVSVSKEAVDFVEANIGKKEFEPYILAFLEGYQLFESEAKKEGVKLSPEFVMLTASQYIFHIKTNEIPEFAKQMLMIDKNFEKPYILDGILKLYRFSRRQLSKGIKKEIKETTDTLEDSKLHYKYINLEDYQTYLAFSKQFIFKDANKYIDDRFYRAESENVFISTNTHAIEIVDEKSNRIAIVILNLFDEGELFADIMSAEEISVDVIETIKRALVDQMRSNGKVIGISIGTNEAPRGEKYNEWRKVLQDSKSPWLKNINWIKFQYLFKNREFGISHKAYRARFRVDGYQQHFEEPQRYIKYSERKKRKEWRRKHYGY